MLVTVDHDSAVPLAEQVATCVRTGLATGRVTRGERLPTARDLAAALGVNMHTVLRAYQQLRDEGIVQMRQGRGAWIAQDADAGLSRVRAMAADLVAEAARHGLTRDDVVGIIRGDEL